MRGGRSGRATQECDWWKYIDGLLSTAIQNYKDLRKVHGDGCLVFIDLIIKLEICRAYANNVN